MEIIRLEKKVLKKNKEIAEENRNLFKRNNLKVHNIIGSPGTGKTCVIERIIDCCRERYGIGVVEGDCQTDRDAQRIKERGVPVVQIVTDGGCHLNAAQVQKAVAHLSLENLTLLFIENVGNLVCPTHFDLGENYKWVISSTTEGDDKPLKYPGIFQASQIMIINKIDLIPYVDCDIDTLRTSALTVNPKLKVFPVSGKTGDGIGTLCNSLFGSET